MQVSAAADPSQSVPYEQGVSQGQVLLLRKAQEQPAQDVDQLLDSMKAENLPPPPPFPSHLGKEVDISA